MKLSSIRLFVSAACVLLFLLSPLSAQRKARDKTVGACTRKVEFADSQAKIDLRIVALTQAALEDREDLGVEIAKEFGQNGKIENLIRYRNPSLKHVFLPLLKMPKWPIVARALYALKMVGDASVIPQVMECLGHDNPRVRELAANCIGHLGHGSARDSEDLGLTRLLETEKDPFVQSSLRATIRLLSEKKRPYVPWKEKLVGPEDAQRVEWAWVAKGKNSFNRYDAKTLDVPKTESLDWPISMYDDSLFIPVPRSSFGGKKGHAGEDMAWFREGASVFAIGDGIVRLVQGAGGNWGFLALIEHRLSNGDYICSLYGHLSWDILVKPGDLVKKGQRIGTVGLSCSVENGGYGAHLHFGIADGPFRKPKGIYRDGSALNFTISGKRVRAPVVGFAYLPEKPDKNGFPGLGLLAKLPDGKVLTVAVGNVPMAAQVAWIKGYAKNTRGWYNPYDYIREHLASDDE